MKPADDEQKETEKPLTNYRRHPYVATVERQAGYLTTKGVLNAGPASRILRFDYYLTRSPDIDASDPILVEKIVKEREDADTRRNIDKAAATKSRSRIQANDLAVGARLKAVRVQAGLSQRELSKRAKVTNSTVSLIEQESHAPSLASLHRILNAIPISMADFFAMPVSRQNVLTYTADDMAIVTRGRADMRVMGGERRDKRLQMFIEHYSPGADTGRGSISHEGETAALIIEGTVELETSEGISRIEAGGGFHIFGSEPYRLKNIGKNVAIVACAVTPPMI